MWNKDSFCRLPLSNTVLSTRITSAVVHNILLCTSFISISLCNWHPLKTNSSFWFANCKLLVTWTSLMICCFVKNKLIHVLNLTGFFDDVRDTASIAESVKGLCILTLLTLSQATNLRLFQIERVCRRQFQTWRKCRKFSKRVKTLWEKDKIARDEQFILFSQCFQKTCTADT